MLKLFIFSVLNDYINLFKKKNQTDDIRTDQPCGPSDLEKKVNESNEKISKSLKYFVEDLDNVCILGKIYPKPLGNG